MTTITAPSTYSGTSYIGPLILTFKDGVAEYDGDLNDGIRQYLATMGYGVDGSEVREPAAAPEPPDPRDIDEVLVGTELRDAAVDPQPEDFLPPTNAGQANPHGFEVVAPGIHAASGPKPIHPGPVGVSGDLTTPDSDADPNVVKDTDAQQANETALAQAVLVDQTPVPEATAAAAQVDPVNEDARDADTDRAFDPGEHTVAEVNEHLANASDDEKARVIAAELAGKNRATVATT